MKDQSGRQAMLARRRQLTAAGWFWMTFLGGNVIVAAIILISIVGGH